MTPQQFLAQLQRQEPAPVYLFLGPESYQRRVCREKLIERVLAPEERGEGLVRHDLEESDFQTVLEDACSLSLFAPRRLIFVSGAEAALPRGRAAGEEEDGETGSGAARALARYLKDPVPGVVMVFEAARYDFEGDDKAKLERVRKFYSGIEAQIEFRRLTAAQARGLAQELAGRAGVRIGGAELDLLVDALGAEAARIAVEIEKLRLYSGGQRNITAEDVAALVPEARTTTIFALVNALGQGDRQRSLEILDTLIREGEYLPLALAFLSTQFRLALAAREAGLRSPAQVQSYLFKLGVPMWGSRAEQVYRTATTFSREKLAAALEEIFGADQGLRDARPDDRVVMEKFILAVTRP